VANHKSAKKRAKQTIVRTDRNKAKKSEARSIIKKIRLAISEKNKDVAKALLPTVQGIIAKLAKAGILKTNNAARRVSRLTEQVNRI